MLICYDSYRSTIVEKHMMRKTILPPPSIGHQRESATVEMSEVSALPIGTTVCLFHRSQASQQRGLVSRPLF